MGYTNSKNALAQRASAGDQQENIALYLSADLSRRAVEGRRSPVFGAERLRKMGLYQTVKML